MTEVALCHHVLGLTSGIVAFGGEIRGVGHTVHPVHTPDLFEGRTFDSSEKGVGYAQETGFDKISERAVGSVNEPLYDAHAPLLTERVLGFVSTC